MRMLDELERLAETSLQKYVARFLSDDIKQRNDRDSQRGVTRSAIAMCRRYFNIIPADERNRK